MEAIEGWHQPDLERAVGAVQFEAPPLHPVVGLPAGHVENSDVLAVVEDDGAGVLVEQAADVELLFPTQAREDVRLVDVREDVFWAESLRIRAVTRRGAEELDDLAHHVNAVGEHHAAEVSGMLARISAERPTGVAA